MASQETQPASAPSTSGPKTHVKDDCIENIPPSDGASAAFAPKVLIQAGVGSGRHAGTMSETLNMSREAVSPSSAATPSVHSGNSGDNLRSTLTPIFKYLRLGLNRQWSRSLRPVQIGEDDDPNISGIFQELITKECHKVIDYLHPFVERPIEDETLPDISGMDSPSFTVDGHSSTVVASPVGNTTVDLPCVPPETPVRIKSEEEMIDNQNGTFDAQSSMKLNGTTEGNGETFSLQNNTFDAQSSMKLNGTTEANGETISLQDNTFEAQSSMKLSGPSTGASGEPVSLQDNTLDALSSMKLNGTTEANGEKVSFQNNTFDAQSSMKLNGTTTEASSVPLSLQDNTFEAQSSMKLNGTTEANGEKVSFQNNTFDAQSSMKLNGTTTEASSVPLGLQDNTFHAQSLVKLSGTSTGASSEPLSLTFEAQSSMKLSATSAGANGETVNFENNNEAPTFNSDESLDLSSSSLITSTPMPKSKVFTFESGKTSDARLASCVRQKLTTQLPGVSNVVGDRKTFFQLPAASSGSRSLRSSLRPPTQLPSLAFGLLKTRPATAIAGPSEPPVSALPSFKRTTRAEASRNAAAAVSKEGPAILSSISGRRSSAVPESKLPCYGLRKPQPSSLRTSTVWSTAASSSDKPSGSAATVRPKTMTQAPSQPAKRLSTITEALPLAKRTKTAGGTQLAGRPTVALKMPTKAVSHAGGTQLAGRPTVALRMPTKAVSQAECANCQLLKQEVKQLRQEVKQLREELQMYRMDVD